MKRRCWIFLALAWSACSQPARSAASLLPSSVAGAWQRTALRDIPPPAPTIGRAFQAAYSSAGQPAGNLTVDLYEAKVSGTAFEMTQHWKAQPDTVFFSEGRYFVVVKWRQADRQALIDLVRALQKELGDLER